MREKILEKSGLERREFLKFVLASGGAAGLVAAGLRPERAAAGEVMPVSPLILRPFRDLLPVPKPMAPSDPNTWTDPAGRAQPPNPANNGEAPHEIWPTGGPSLYYKIDIDLNPHRFTTSPVMGPNGRPTTLPDSWMQMFNGTFPGPMINARYGTPVMVRFRQIAWPGGTKPSEWGDFGVPSNLTHLHNGHTAPESDGQPFNTRGDGHDSWYIQGNGQRLPYFYDNLYLNMPAGNDDREKQSFFWFHDHRMGNTGSNVYKGCVGLYPIYDPILDPGDETRGLRLPGVPQPDGSILYDVSLGIYDCCFDDGITAHDGINTPESLAYGISQDGRPHPENWGKLFFAHHPNHGFVGDVMTVNGVAYPYLPVKRRKYRFRFLDCSISRWYEFTLMKGAPRLTPGFQGQYALLGAQQCMRMTQIASEGGLLPAPLVRDSFRIAPAKRKEVVVDFSKYMDGSPTKRGDVVYLANTLEMTDGRKPGGQLKTPMALMMFVIDGNPPTPDLSVIPPVLRQLPPRPDAAHLASITHRRFVLERGSGGDPFNQWLINGKTFDPLQSMADVPQGAEEVWEIVNGGGGWMHPLHIHMEEHQVISRNGKAPPPEDISKEDVVALAESEEVHIYRKFRTFTGRYVCHCHNLAHEDHAMMFGWQILPPP